jgi:LPS sulfotransferase NodH
LLKDTGVAGRPAEYFEARHDTGLPPHPGDYLADLPRTGAGIRDDLRPPQAPSHSSLAGLGDYRDHLRRTFELGTTPNGVFASKLMWRQLPELQALAGELPEFAKLERTELLARLFGDPSYVWVSRRDKVRQGVSLWRALQTRSWRRERAPGDATPDQLLYSFEGIDHLVRALTSEDTAWKEFFSAHLIDVLKVSYEDGLEVDQDRTIKTVLDHIGVPAPAGWRAAEPIKRQSDSLSDDWVAAYHQDSAQRGSERDTAAVAGF